MAVRSCRRESGIITNTGRDFIRDTTEYIAVDDINEEDLGKIAVIVSEQYI